MSTQVGRYGHQESLAKRLLNYQMILLSSSIDLLEDYSCMSRLIVPQVLFLVVGYPKTLGLSFFSKKNHRHALRVTIIATERASV